MKQLMICLLLAGCASHPIDLVGRPLSKAISVYGEPETAVDYEGARAFFFKADESQQKSKPKPKLKVLLNPDMPLPQTDYQITKCVVIANALWTSSKEEWTIHSVDQAGNCKQEK